MCFVVRDEAPEWLTRRLPGPHLPRLRAWMAAHPEVQVMCAHMAPALYGREA